MTNNRSVSPSSLSMASRSSIISESISITLAKPSSNNLDNISYLQKNIQDERTSKKNRHQQQIVINTLIHEPKKISQFHLNRLRNQSHKQFYRRQQKFS